MPRRAAWIVPLALLAVSCASPAKLAQQSGEALQKGDVDRAYDRALRAIEKDAESADVRAAYERASDGLAASRRGSIRDLAATDSLGAAESAYQYAHFRSEVLAHGASIHEDAKWLADESRLYGIAARTWYRRGSEALAAKKPKAAWKAFGNCRRFIPGYADAGARQALAHEQATVRVAVMPFEDGVDVRGLSLESHTRTSAELAKLGAGHFEFTRFVDSDSVEAMLTLADARGLSREAAIAAGRRLGVQRVIAGRFAGLRSDDDSKELVQPIVHRVEIKDGAGVEHTKYEESQITVRTRSRRVRLQTEIEIIDVASGVTLERHTYPKEAFAQTIWTDLRPEGDCSRYMLLSPDARKADPDRAKRVDAQWKERVGSWTLPALLERAQKARDRSRYRSDYRREFLGDTRSRPVWLGELPSVDDLASCAIDDLWKSFVVVLEEQDARE